MTSKRQRLLKANASVIMAIADDEESSDNEDEDLASETSEANSSAHMPDAEARALLASRACGERCNLLYELPSEHDVHSNEIRSIHRDCESTSAQLMDELYRLQRFDEAKTLGCLALRATNKIWCNEPRLESIPLVMKLADCNRELQQFEEAEKGFLQVLQIVKQHDGGERSLAHAKAEVNLAGLYHRSIA